MKPKVIIAINTAWNLVNFRLGLMRAIEAAGFEVLAVSPYDEHADELAKLGIRHVVMPMDNRGTNPVKDFVLLWRMLRLLRREKPVAYLGYTIKPNVYGSIAAKLLGIPVINNISGLGATFIQQNLVTRVVRLLYRLGLFKSHTVFFQNADDRELFVRSGLVAKNITDLLPGSGVNLAHFPLAALPAKRSPFRFLLMGRMLWDKGVGEFIQAARSVHASYPHTEFCLLGFVDSLNPKAISANEVAAWDKEAGIRYLGSARDVRSYIAEAHCVVLPSYREGTPKALLEGAAMGRPLIATDVPGCREVVDHGVNGYLCTVRSAEDLADKMIMMMQQPDAELKAMAAASRNKVERQFDETLVIKKYLGVLQDITGN